MALPIEDYALIGDCETAALVGRNGSIDWLCLPRFDSEACFASLLGEENNGRWLIAATDPKAKVTRRYRPDTLILETRFETETGAATVIDFMYPCEKHPNVIRLVVGEKGTIEFESEIIVRFGYGESVPWVTTMPDGRLRMIAGPSRIVLQSSVELRGENFKTKSTFEVKQGQTESFALSYTESWIPEPVEFDAESLIHGTEMFWKNWTSKCTMEGPYADIVKRSLITLKAMTYEPTGGVVAAATTSLPEHFGGPRNWDYRYCWVRDATLTLLALMNTGYYDEARSWREWLLRAVAGSPRQMQIMYGIAGERRLYEFELPWLKGYENSTPVRIGNAAHDQVQLDVYGEMLDAVHQARKGGLAPLQSGWDLQLAIIEQVEDVWQKPDEGIWEVRSGPEQFVYSKVMAWVAFDRTIRSAERFKLEGPIERWRETREAIHKQVCEQGYNKELNSFVRSYGSTEVDASLLLIPAMGFLPATDPRMVGTVEQIEKTLMKDGLVQRYDTSKASDGLPPGEGMFLACSFWLVDAYLMMGREKDAIALFERLIGLSNDLGLLSEEYDTEAKRLCGNFPQAFSHLALVNSACNLGRNGRPVEQRTNTEKAAAPKKTATKAGATH
ncbi:glycoside hydrolase family 15 protein [Methyloceanibacter caenitepidi]|uniref:Trehalase n=1 Tax=Methyloceanibacter caenitepidi TaxID=1384459 RepID=A0A0A8K6N4_9HYPH|nr:glycoside hydrolase family 15 protein [Methyloceanibacter caenitepidi]BAQ18613.1 glucoamylase [Methyloceanibacter caenitepidi]